jgi:hypothetical protein
MKNTNKLNWEPAFVAGFVDAREQSAGGIIKAPFTALAKQVKWAPNFKQLKSWQK